MSEDQEKERKGKKKEKWEGEGKTFKEFFFPCPTLFYKY